MQLLRARTTPLLAAAVALSSGCTTVAQTVDTGQAHHRPGGFQNNHIEFAPKGLLRLLEWKAQALAAGLPKPPQTPTPTVAPELDFIQANAKAGAAMQPAVTWIGHATALVQAGGVNVLTDPIFSERASPVDFLGPKRAQAPGLSLGQLPRIDLVVVSHNHYDHFDLASMKALAAQAGGPPTFIVPLGNKALLTSNGIDAAKVVELDWWRSHRHIGPAGPVEVFLVPVQHWSGRSLTDRMQALWGGYAVFTPGGFNWHFSGDTGYSPDFAETRRRFASRLSHGGFDLALIPIGAYEPRWFMAEQHVNPAEAIKIHRDLGAAQSVAIHWGTFELTDESLDEPPRALAAALQAERIAAESFAVLAVGQTRRLQRPAAKTVGQAQNPTP
jgi:N-acyl-phosphatidylethanolamine-hydrolysing phospholipase D